MSLWISQMLPGSVFFDRELEFKDEQSGEKLFIALGSSKSTHLVDKITSKQHG